MSVLLITFVLITWSLPPKGKSSGTSAASWWQAGPAGGQFREATEVESHTLSLVSHTEWYFILWYRIQCSGIVYYGCNTDYYGLDRALLYPVESGPIFVHMTLHSGKIEQTQQCGSKDRPNLVWRTQWYIIGTQWYCRKHSQRGICHVLLHTLSQVLQLSVYSKSVWPGPNTAPATSCQRRSKCLVSQTFCKSLLLCRSKCQRTPTGVT